MIYCPKLFVYRFICVVFYLPTRDILEMEIPTMKKLNISLSLSRILFYPLLFLPLTLFTLKRGRVVVIHRFECRNPNVMTSKYYFEFIFLANATHAYDEESRNKPGNENIIHRVDLQ